MRRYGNLDYARLTKSGFLLGLGLLAAGAIGEVLGTIVFETLPEWELTVFFYSEVFGVAIGFFSVILFGIVLPLTE